MPCITIRENTERPVTVDEGSNVLAGTDPARIVAEARKVLRGEGKQGRRPHLWDGKEPTDWKPMDTVGAGVKEIRIQDESGAFRVIYLAKLADAVYVLHCFQEKTQQTSGRDIKLARKRFKDLMKEQP